ncbi:MAG TPA: bifunctional phosphopantothenoylcysteine decarboxylase/phosphopantothenate--cysteine ligase CoaBC [Acidimicrobiales bacterium]|nr:bifunctional phosphopantothenoylcysteine decarboxylase/phosphopantothenate--cysteine ligase CoaBC [Acidimicrobiales bacterium]
MHAGPLAGKRVVLGVCGGIAAYKAVEICRRLVEAGAVVSPVLTPGATRFVGALTFSALASEPASVSLFGEDPAPSGQPGQPGPGRLNEAGPSRPGAAGRRTVPHVELGQEADAVLVAPATARLVGSYAAGISSDLLTATLLATKAPVLLCPAMHTEMWEHPAVQHNIEVLRGRGVVVLEPEEGRLAGGDIGKGRLPEPGRVLDALRSLLGRSSGPLAGCRAVVTAGGTREPLDPVRYIANRSSGKQGYAVAAELLARGAAVVLVTSSERPAPAGAEVVKVETAAEMTSAVLGAADHSDVVVMAAAVADYRPAAPAERKIAKSSAPLVLELVPTVDVLAELGARRRPGQVLVGFAAETAPADQLAARGRAKLLAKGADIVVANDVGTSGTGFGQDRSRAVIVCAGSETDLGLVDKKVVAAALVDAVAALLARTGEAGAGQRGTRSDR